MDDTDRFELRIISPVEWGHHFKLPSGALAYYMKRVLVYNGVLLAAFQKNKVVGVAILECESGKWNWVLNYIYVQENFRKQGVATCLVKALPNYLPPYARCLFARVVADHSYAEVASKLLVDGGFLRCSSASIYTCAVTGNRVRGLSAQLREKWKGVFSRQENAGYRYLPFSAVSKDDMSKFIKASYTEFPLVQGMLTSIYDPIDKLDMDKSILALRDNRPAAFGMVTTIDAKTLFFQKLAVSFRDSGKGLSIGLCAAFADTLADSGGCDLLFTIYEENEKMKRIRDTLLLPLIDKCEKQINYQYMINA